MIAIAGASGQLGRLVIQDLLDQGYQAGEIVALGRNLAKMQDLSDLGIITRLGDYDHPDTLEAALIGVDRLLLISATDIGQRARQHLAILAAAQKTGIKHIIYTSLLKTDTSPLVFATEHLETENALAESGLDITILRNGWYLENYLGVLETAKNMKSVFGAAQQGKISAASRRDYAAAAAKILVHPTDHIGKTYELSGDQAFNMAELTEILADVMGTDLTYVNLGQTEYAQALIKAGLPESLALALADADEGAAKGWLYDEGQTLSQLIGRPTTTLKQVFEAALS